MKHSPAGKKNWHFRHWCKSRLPQLVMAETLQFCHTSRMNSGLCSCFQHLIMGIGPYNYGLGFITHSSETTYAHTFPSATQAFTGQISTCPVSSAQRKDASKSPGSHLSLHVIVSWLAFVLISTVDVSLMITGKTRQLKCLWIWPSPTFFPLLVESVSYSL